MRIFDSHRLRRDTVARAQRIHMDHPEDPPRVQTGMRNLFEDYFDRKPSNALLGKAQTMLGHHQTNRTAQEKYNFTASLFDVCARRDERFATARLLADFCNLPQSLARDQAIGDASQVEEADYPALEQAYRAAFQVERVTEALAFYLARNLGLQDLHDLASIIDDPQVISLRAKVAALLRATPEAQPIGMDLVGRSVANMHLLDDPAGPLPGVPFDMEVKVRELLKATWSQPVSQAGMTALCRGLHVADVQRLTGALGAEPCLRLYKVYSAFVETLPGVHRGALASRLADALRERLPRLKAAKKL